MRLKKIIILILFLIVPHNLSALEKYKLPDDLSQEERSKKIDSLKWYNWDDPEDHYLQYQEADAEIYILENEYYLRNNDVNQYSWWVFGHENINNDIMILSDLYTVYSSYEDDGYVSLDDWKDIKPADLLTEMRNIQDAWREDLKAKGLNYVEKMDWIFKPTFDEENKSVLMSYEADWVKPGGNKYKTMQTNAIILGRKGHIELSFVYSIDENTTDEDLKEYSSIAKDFTNGVSFKEGARHADYKSGDKVAAVGIGGLVAGTLGVKALAKAGVFAKFIPLLAKFWWIILAPIAAFGFFGKKTNSNSNSEQIEPEEKPKRKRRSKKID